VYIQQLKRTYATRSRGGQCILAVAQQNFDGWGKADQSAWGRSLPSIVIGQVGGGWCLVDNVIRTIRGAGTVSGHDGQTFLEKIRRQASKFFFSFAPPGFNDMDGKRPSCECDYLNKS